MVGFSLATRALRLFGASLNRLLPKGIFGRSLIIIITPMLILQGVVAYVFMERHWSAVTERLSAAFVRDLSALVHAYETLGQRAEAKRLIVDSGRMLGWRNVAFLDGGMLPPALARPAFDMLDVSLVDELRAQIRRPFWVDTTTAAGSIEVRILLDGEVLQVNARRSQASVSNGHIFLVWMALSSLVLIAIAVLFLRNQIRPIMALADAAEAFGKGRDAELRPRGAREVRRAGFAFIEMKRRIERAIEQRTAMLNGVSHDLRTVLTRFRLSLTFLPDGPETDDLRRDVDEMNDMLEAYLAFARGDAGEQARPTDLKPILDALKSDAERAGHRTRVLISGDPTAIVRPAAFKRLLANLVSNAARYGDRIEINAQHDARWLQITIDDDGPGIPQDKRDVAFRPFHRLDEARNLDDHGGSGLGLAIARDIARSHGGDVTLAQSPLGGLRATVRVPA
jgi:two-component system osmolarity sensor histidine kinase EnvZ